MYVSVVEPLVIESVQSLFDAPEMSSATDTVPVSLLHGLGEHAMTTIAHAPDTTRSIRRNLRDGPLVHFFGMTSVDASVGLDGEGEQPKRTANAKRSFIRIAHARDV